MRMRILVLGILMLGCSGCGNSPKKVITATIGTVRQCLLLTSPLKYEIHAVKLHDGACNYEDEKK